MWETTPWAQPRTSFPRPMAAPTAGPCDPPLVCIEINEAYIPFIAGAMSQLIQRTTWTAADEDHLQQILSNMTWAIEVIGTAVQCNQPPLIPGQPVATRACNIAGYISNYVIRHAITQAIQAVNNNSTILGFLDLLGFVLIPVFPITSVVVGAFIYLYQRMVPTQIAAFQAAIDDPTLFGAIACAVYQAIKTDGQVTPTNYPTLVTNVTALTFASSYVKDTVLGVITQMGPSGLATVQVPGVVADYDCSNCGTGPALGPIGPDPFRIGGTGLLQIAIGAADAVLPILFPKPFTTPPLLTMGTDNEDVVGSFLNTTTMGTDLRITSAVPALATMSANVDWVAEMPGVE